ncbi:MAG: histidinol-phosphatase [Planctomycetaceae bacterium]|nr:histidinol-phosphatase [Planctomycetaceae bacterium]
MTSDLDQRLRFGLAAAREAQHLILKHYQSAELAVEVKSDESPVTVADRGAEQLIRERLADAFPQDGVFGEEFGESEGTNGYRWILDPIDGTKAFVAGVPLFGCMLGLERDGDCALGIVRFPALDEVVYATVGGGAWWQRGVEPPRPAHVTKTSQLRESLLCFTDVDGWLKVAQLDTFERLVRSARIVRGWGDCYGHCLVALGRADVMIDPLLNPWDAAALVPIVEEAGGRFVAWNGERTIHGGNGVSSNGRLQDEILALLQENHPT